MERQRKGFLNLLIIILIRLQNLQYPHIPHKDGLESMRKVLSEFKEIVSVSEWYVDGVDLIEMAAIILENNYFEFDGDILYIGKSRGQLLVLSLRRLMPIYLCMFWRQQC